MDKRATFKTLTYTDEEYAAELERLREKFSAFLNVCRGEQEADSFVRLLAKAEQENDYVLAIRVNYSALLQMLDKEEVIRWDVSKTNQHYIYEIKNEAWSRDFEEISRIFDCVCYGEFPVDETAYQNIKRYFTEFRKEVEG